MMKYKTPGHKILVRLDPLEEEQEIAKNFKGLADSKFKIVKPDGQDYRERLGVDTGVVVSIGKMAWKAIDGNQEGWEPWCKVGDRIVFGRYCGKLVPDPDTGNEDLYVINDDDVQLVLEEA